MNNPRDRVVISGIDMTPIMLSIAAKLAHMDSQLQADFLNAFAKELVLTCGTYQQAEMQACFIRDEASQSLKDLCGMISYEADNS